MAVHEVKAGENLWRISSLYGVSINRIMNVNGLTSSSIIPGLALYIPNNQMPLRTYRIKFGDDLWQLATKYNTTLSMILAANPGINPTDLKIGQLINIPSPVKLEITTLGFIVPTSSQNILNILNSLAGQLTYLAVVAYAFNNQGFAFNEVDDSAIVMRCHQLNITPLLMIRNFINEEFNADLAGNVLENPTFRQNLVSSIVDLTRQRGFGGVSIDIEFIPPARRNDFIIFLTSLKTELGGLILHVNVHAKAADLPTNRIVGAYDYAAIGNIVDIVAVMTIDYGYPGGPPAPIAPIYWIEQVIQYALSQMDSRKLQIAMSLYGYDKTVRTNETRALSVLAAQNQAITTGSIIRFDKRAKAPWYSYWRGTVEHIVWFQDIRSYIEKYKLIDTYQLIGTTYWQISLPAPQNWEYVRDNITVVKE